MSNKQQQRPLQLHQQEHHQGRSCITKKKGGSLCTILLLLLLVCQEILHFYYVDNIDDTNMKVSKFIIKHPQQTHQKNNKEGDDKAITAAMSKSPEIIALETPCRKNEVPPFVTFAVYWIRGRWGRYGIPKAVRILYSSVSFFFQEDLFFVFALLLD